MNDSTTPQPEPHSARGIYRAAYLRDGYPVVELIDSRGRCLASVTLVRGLTPSTVRRLFREILNEADPKLPRLKLVTPDPGHD